jgi:hypothetical protein
LQHYSKLFLIKLSSFSSLFGDDKENKKHVLGARRLADKAALDHAFMMRA